MKGMGKQTEFWPQQTMAGQKYAAARPWVKPIEGDGFPPPRYQAPLAQLTDEDISAASLR